MLLVGLCLPSQMSVNVFCIKPAQHLSTVNVITALDCTQQLIDDCEDDLEPDKYFISVIVLYEMI